MINTKLKLKLNLQEQVYAPLTTRIIPLNWSRSWYGKHQIDTVRHTIILARTIYNHMYPLN